MPDLVCVINYSCPNHLEDYVHRVGRTGRAGRKGTAYTFISTEEDKHAPTLIKALTQSKQKVIYAYTAAAAAAVVLSRLCSVRTCSVVVFVHASRSEPLSGRCAWVDGSLRLPLPRPFEAVLAPNICRLFYAVFCGDLCGVKNKARQDKTPVSRKVDPWRLNISTAVSGVYDRLRRNCLTFEYVCMSCIMLHGQGK